MQLPGVPPKISPRASIAAEGIARPEIRPQHGNRMAAKQTFVFGAIALCAVAPVFAQCTLRFSPASAAVPAFGGSGSFAVSSSTASCGAISATSQDATWLQVQSAGSRVQYTWSVNTSVQERTATIRAGAGSGTLAYFQVKQAGLPFKLNSMGSSAAVAMCQPFVTPLSVTGLVPGMRVMFRGNFVESTWLAANTLLATFPAHFMATPGKISVSLVRPNGEVSNSLPFEVLDGVVPYPLTGLNLGVFVVGDPNLDSRVSEATLESLIPKAVRFAQWLKFFGSTNGMEKAPAIAKRYGRKVAMVAWIGRNLVLNESELASVIQLARAGLVDEIVVGSESILRGDVTVAQLIAYIGRVRAAVPGVPVTTADSYGVYRDNPALIAAVSLVSMNVYPNYWENGSVELAVATIHRRVEEMRALSGGKTIEIGEAGEPSAGPARGAAVPSIENSAYFLKNIHSWSLATGTKVFFFEGTDEGYKEKYEGAGIRWGVLSADGVFKPGMCEPIYGSFLADNWSGTQIVGGTGTPGIEILSVPPRGVAGLVKGRVLHVRPADYRVALYLRVAGGYWSKPTFATPYVTVAPDGTWEANVLTGGNDLDGGDRVVAVLIPASLTPPQAAGTATLPATLQSYPQAQADR